MYFSAICVPPLWRNWSSSEIKMKAFWLRYKINRSTTTKNAKRRFSNWRSLLLLTGTYSQWKRIPVIMLARWHKKNVIPRTESSICIIISLHHTLTIHHNVLQSTISNDRSTKAGSNYMVISKYKERKTNKKKENWSMTNIAHLKAQSPKVNGVTQSIDTHTQRQWRRNIAGSKYSIQRSTETKTWKRKIPKTTKCCTRSGSKVHSAMTETTSAHYRSKTVTRTVLEESLITLDSCQQRSR